MIDPKHIRNYVLDPVLSVLDHDRRNAEELLMLTAAMESAMGRYLHQIGIGPACGIFQMEPRTHDDIWENYLKYQYDLAKKVRGFQIKHLFEADRSEQLCGNLYYAAAMARVHYLRVPDAIPDYQDIKGLAEYYKRYYNTALGASSVEATIAAYKKFVNDKS